MFSVPSFVAQRLYVQGSLRPAADGFQFEVRNSLGAGYAQQMLSLTLDGDEVPLGSCSLILDGQETPFSAVTPESPFTLALGRSIVLHARGVALTPGTHRIGVGIDVRGLGRVHVEVTDRVAAS